MGARTCAVLIGLSLILGWAGVWAGDRVAKLLGDDDPSVVVIDEVVGQLLTYSMVPVSGMTLTDTSFAAWMVCGFFLFRALDIVKPGPIDAAQEAHGGLGIMADDFLAGVLGGWAMLVVALMV
jgi:phosphatidylglycerophosphatase A